jgi:hypothetical protein
MGLPDLPSSVGDYPQTAKDMLTFHVADGPLSLGNREGLANEPIIVVVPGTLIEQWRMELYKFLLPKTYDIFVYPKTKKQREDFWNPKGPWAQSKQSPGDKILLVPQSVSRRLPSSQVTALGRHC